MKTKLKQLRFTSTKPSAMAGIFTSADDKRPLILADDTDVLTYDKVKGRTAYIHDDAEDLAGYDIPYYIDGNIGQFDLPVEEQDILMILPSGRHQCKAELSMDAGSFNAYLITLKK